MRVLRPLDREDRLRRFAPFALAAVLGWVLVPLHPGTLQATPLIVAGVLFVIVVVAVVLVPWVRLPRGTWVLPPIAYMVVVALMREGGGGLTSGYNPLFLLPVFWLALYGTPQMLGVGLTCYALAELVWVIGHGTRQVTVAVLSTAVTTIICTTVQRLVRRARRQAADLEAIGKLPGRRATEERPEVLCTALCEIAVELCEAAIAVLYRRRDSGELVPVAASVPGGADLDVGLLGVPRAASAAAVAGQSVFVGDTCAEPDADLRLAALPGGRSVLWEPAVNEGTIQGVLAVGWPRRMRAPEDRACAVMKILSAEAAVTLERNELLALRARQLQELRELDRLKTDFVSSASHELRTPITSIRGYLDILVEGEAGELTEEQRGFLGVVDRNAHRLQALVEDLLVVSRIESGRLELSVRDVDLLALSDRVAESMAPQLAQGGVRLTLRGTGPLEMPVDERRVEQVLTNLVSNAVKFTERGGEVTVTVAEQDGGAQLTVADSGIGISPQDLRHLFEKFFRAETATERGIPGTGLGLAICRGIIEAHGGTIAVDSVPGEGTTVRVHIPRPDVPR
ncbi:MAG TPA: GAF domain-containing sensor histidine kinase [Solirubrobacteraceae bacterium]|nr:GAF domain-containing sensor histidine kinase [Solirubrobacteraceae bacterium]